MCFSLCSKVIAIAQIYNVKCSCHIHILCFTLLHADMFCTTGKLRSGSKVMQEAVPASMSNEVLMSNNDWLSGNNPQHNLSQLSAADNAVYNKSSLSKCNCIVVIHIKYICSCQGCCCISDKQQLYLERW